VAGEFFHVGNANGGPFLRGRAHDTAAEGNAHARGLPLERTKNELPAFEQIKAGPIHVGQCMENERRAIGHVRDRISFPFDHGADLGRQLAIKLWLA
jgi:hypothetical protein